MKKELFEGAVREKERNSSQWFTPQNILGWAGEIPWVMLTGCSNKPMAPDRAPSQGLHISDMALGPHGRLVSPADHPQRPQWTVAARSLSWKMSPVTSPGRSWRSITASLLATGGARPHATWPPYKTSRLVAGFHKAQASRKISANRFSLS